MYDDITVWSCYEEDLKLESFDEYEQEKQLAQQKGIQW